MPDSGSTLRVREGGQHDEAPRYFARKLPYASDVGIATGASLGFATKQLAVIEAGNELIAMTWQGRLVNSCLAASLTSSGVETRATSFALLLRGILASRLITLIREAAFSLSTQNPLFSVAVESIVDVGPYFRLLSADAQTAARRDWLDSQYITCWVETLEDVVTIEPQSALGTDLIALSAL